VHLDAALSGIPLALDDRWRAVVDLGVPGSPDSLCVSGHKFLGTPLPCGVVLARRGHVNHITRPIDYISGPDVTISGSRPGLAALQLWYALRRPGLLGHRARATAARELARYTVARLRAIGWECWRHEHAFTVVLRTPPAPVLARWSLATEGRRSHIVCMPGVQRAQIDAFVADLVEHRHLALAEAG
jgi:histidine decarboxylase